MSKRLWNSFARRTRIFSQTTTTHHHRYFSSSSFSDRLRADLQSIDELGLTKRERIIISPQKSSIRISSQPDTPVLNFCANNYLGLSDNSELISAAKDGLNTHGLGLSSVRFICGTQDLHINLEKKISQYHCMEDCILYPSCFDANAGIFEALLTPEDAIITDKLNHASIIDGIRLCKAQRYLYEHMDMINLELKCEEAHSNGSRNRLIVTDGCFSMDGDIAPLNQICDIADKYDCKVMIDDCHATGFLGPHGRGTDDFWGLWGKGRVDIINSTLGKALGGATGGYTVGSQEVIDMLRQKSRPYLFSNALAPSLVSASIKCFSMIENDTSLRDKLEKNIFQFRSEMSKVGFNLMGHESHPIAPVMLKDAKLAQLFAQDMLSHGIYVIGFFYPVVPQNEARIRVQISAAHTEEQIDQCVAAFKAVAEKHGVL